MPCGMNPAETAAALNTSLQPAVTSFDDEADDADNSNGLQ